MSAEKERSFEEKRAFDELLLRSRKGKRMGGAASEERTSAQSVAENPSWQIQRVRAAVSLQKGEGEGFNGPR